MVDRISRGTQYVVVQNDQPKKPTRYYYDTDPDVDEDDDDDDSQMATITRRVVRTKPFKEQRIKYVSTNDLQPDHRRQRIVEPSDRKIKIRNTINGEPVVLDEDDNVIKIVRNARSPSPPLVENRQIRVRAREPRTLYYETSDGRLVARPSKNHTLVKSKNDFTYAEDEPSKLVRRVILDPRTGDQETIYDRNKPKKQHRKKYIVRKYANDTPVDSDDDYEQQPQQQSQYVEVVQRRTVPTQVVAKQEIPQTKYVMIRKKVDSEPGYVVTSSIPTTKTNRRIVYETATKKPSTTYVYSSDGKYYK